MGKSADRESGPLRKQRDLRGANIFIERQGLPSQQIWFVPWWLVGGALAFSLVASLLSGAYPAGRAARLEPLDALRYE